MPITGNKITKTINALHVLDDCYWLPKFARRRAVKFYVSVNYPAADGAHTA